MPFNSQYLFAVSMDIPADKEALFNEVYDTEHIPNLKKIPGVISVARYKMQELTMIVGGQRQTIALKDEPRYSALYQIERPDVVATQAWNEASDLGRWPGQVRPYTQNRRHVLRRLIYASHEPGAAVPQTRYLFSASMDVEIGREALFNEVYDKDHIPFLMDVPGVVSVARFETARLVRLIEGQRRIVVAENEPKYSALYELESPDVLTSPAWARAVDKGRWPSEVRPYTRNRRHVLRKLIYPG